MIWQTKAGSFMHRTASYEAVNVVPQVLCGYLPALPCKMAEPHMCHWVSPRSFCIGGMPIWAVTWSAGPRFLRHHSVNEAGQSFSPHSQWVDGCLRRQRRAVQIPAWSGAPLEQRDPGNLRHENGLADPWEEGKGVQPPMEQQAWRISPCDRYFISTFSLLTVTTTNNCK